MFTEPLQAKLDKATSHLCAILLKHLSKPTDPSGQGQIGLRKLHAVDS